FSCRNGSAAAVDRDALFEVEMDRVIPPAAAIDEGPVLDLPRLRHQQVDAVGVHRVSIAPVDLDGPREHREFRTVGRAFTRLRVARVASALPAPLDYLTPPQRDYCVLYITL